VRRRTAASAEMELEEEVRRDASARSMTTSICFIASAAIDSNGSSATKAGEDRGRGIIDSANVEVEEEDDEDEEEDEEEEDVDDEDKENEEDEKEDADGGNAAATDAAAGVGCECGYW
jgi:hypothetical protein